MNKFKEIRPIVLGLAIKNNKTLVFEGFDTVKNQTFKAKWIDIDDVKNRSKILYPEEIFKYL